MTDIDAGYTLLAISAAAWIFYAASITWDEYRARRERRKSMLHWIRGRWAVPRENVRGLR